MTHATNLPAIRDTSNNFDAPRVETLDDLWTEARILGTVDIHTMDSGAIFTRIKFMTPANTSVEATSGFDHKEIRSSIRTAINNANTIRGQFK